MVNRTSRPIALNQSRDLTAMGIHTRARVPAFLGDGVGNVEAIANGADSSHYGKVLIRFASGLDNDGNTNFSQAVTARSETFFPHKTNLPVLVQKDGTTDEWVVVQIDYKRTVAAGLNTNAYNPLAPALQRVHLRQIVEGNAFAVSTDANPSTKIVVEPLVIYYNGSLFNAGKTVADNVDLASFIPAAGVEKLVAIGERLYDRSIQIVDGTTRDISSTKYSLSDVNILASSFDDMILPLRAVRLANDSGTVTQVDMHLDLRQFINVERPRGFPNPVIRHTYIETGFQEAIHGKLYITTGKMHLAGKLVMRQ